MKQLTTDMKKEVSDEIKKRLRKILKLAEKGYEGEMQAAKIKLQALLNEYGLTIDDICENEKESMWVFYNIITDTDYTLLIQTAFSVLEKSEIKGYRRNGECAISCTESQSNEILDKYEWHKKNFKQELKNMQKEFLEAYCIKHHLIAPANPDSKDDTPIDIEKLRRILLYTETITDKSYYKSLKQ